MKRLILVLPLLMAVLAVNMCGKVNSQSATYDMNIKNNSKDKLLTIYLVSEGIIDVPGIVNEADIPNKDSMENGEEKRKEANQANKAKLFGVGESGLTSCKKEGDCKAMIFRILLDPGQEYVANSVNLDFPTRFSIKIDLPNSNDAWIVYDSVFLENLNVKVTQYPEKTESLINFKDNSLDTDISYNKFKNAGYVNLILK